MRRSLRLLIAGVVVPAALSPLIYRALFSAEDRGTRAVLTVERVEGPAEVVMVQVTERVVEGSDADCSFARTENLDQAAREGGLLEIEAGSGSLRVEGAARVDRISVHARMCASSPELLAGLVATLESNGSVARVGTRYPRTSGGLGNRYARIDLAVEVPRGTSLDIEDSSGSMYLEEVGSVEIDDSSGDIEIRGATGSVRIKDGSGGILVIGVVGDVDVEDGSGGVEVRDVQGSVRVDDGSGSVDVAEVTHDVFVNDGSGSIEVTGVGGDFVVEDDGSGGIQHSRVEGRIDVPVRERRGG